MLLLLLLWSLSLLELFLEVVQVVEEPVVEQGGVQLALEVVRRHRGGVSRLWGMLFRWRLVLLSLLGFLDVTVEG